MNDQATAILHALQHAHFPHPVAIRAAHDVELGPVLEADALDVPSPTVLSQQEALAGILWPHAFGAATVLPGACDLAESERLRAALPAGTAWYLPTGPRRSSTP